ncbi:hybrid sensor histidine kinase/response regulator [Bacteroides intestinalis]|jgi:signal transduction histidine kinase/CheY-like chemotaxis protein|uniref:hybrid sensor histidine kinase/response regulator n=1 Tax=Bacteroides intestinalis TaxID=329854 RepID=UPI0022E6F4A5|nr:hybrid sensor histidine kinase/response regulator [Bacteroides intestinalis]
MIQARLKLEIIVGYLIWVSFFVWIVYIIHDSRQKKSAMDRQEAHWQGERQATNRAFLGLLDLASTGELIADWTEDDYAAYQKKREATVTLLQNLKSGQEDSSQRACIDSVCSLLVEKETRMAELLQLLENMPDAGEIVHRKIPAAVPQSKKNVSGKEEAPAIQTGEKKKKSFWGIFRKREKKSAYARQREEAQTTPIPAATSGTGTTATKPSALLHSIEKEIDHVTRQYEETLSAKVDSLRLHNRRLNDRINLLVQKFEEKERESFCREIRWQQETRTHTFRLIADIGIGAFVLVILLYMVIHRDVNRQHKIRMELEASNRKNEELSQSRQNILLTVSHDLCAPLSTINGYAELIPEEKDEAQRNRYAENILNASHHVIGLANNLLYYYRLEAGKEQPDKETFHPGRVIENVLHPFRTLADKKGLGLTVETEGVNTMVEGDRIRLTQILNNLLTNAVKFTPAGYVHVGVRYADGWLRFFVRDTGTGISEDRQENLFKAFERLDADNTQPGFGLGLSITARLVGLLGGTISVESRSGHGSTFEVCLPMQEAGGPETASVQRVEYARLSGLKAVLIDDDRIQADMARRMLARSGVACDCCHDIKELTELLRGRRYDLLLTDMQMPEADGHTVLALLRNSNLGQSRDIPVLAVTARTDGETEQMKRDGFAGFLHKPFSMDELLAAVAECTGDRIPQRQGPDFTALLEGEDDRKEILDMFVQDMEKTTADLRKAIGTKDYAGIISLIHKGTPLWETIRMDIPAAELERLASLVPEAWDEAAVTEVWKLVTTVDEAVEKAKELKEGME